MNPTALSGAQIGGQTRFVVGFVAKALSRICAAADAHPVRRLPSLLYGTQFMEILPMTKVAPIKPTISLDVLDKVDIRVGTIELVEDVQGSDKLVKLTVDFGDHKRSILVGMKQERQNPKEVEGKQALFVVNLEPKVMMGEISEGMLFDIGYADGITPVLAVPEKLVPNGTRAG
jgi:tRNA-binding protein